MEFLIVIFILWILFDYLKDKQRLKKLFNDNSVQIYQLNGHNLEKYNLISSYETLEKEVCPKVTVYGKYLLFKGNKYTRYSEFNYKSDFNQEAIFNPNSGFTILEPYEVFSIISNEEYQDIKNGNKTDLIMKEQVYESKEHKLLKKYKINYIYHMTHVNNLQNILQYGLHSHNNKLVKNKIDNENVQKRRDYFESIYNKNVHSYVPFYFNPKNAMLYVNKDIQGNLIILAFDNNLIYQKGSLFTDGNASVENITKFYNNLNDLDKLDWNCINTKYWNDIEDGRRKRMSEILVPDKVNVNKLKKIYCINNHIKSYIDNIMINYPNIKVEVNTKIFF